MTPTIEAPRTITGRNDGRPDLAAVARTKTDGLLGCILGTPAEQPNPKLLRIAQDLLPPGRIEDPVQRTIYATMLATVPLTNDALLDTLGLAPGPGPPNGWRFCIDRLKTEGPFADETTLPKIIQAVIQANADARDDALIERAFRAKRDGADVAAVSEMLRRGLAQSVQDKIAKSRPKPLDLEAIAATGVPPVPWIIPGWLTVDDVGILGGGPYAGKTTTAYDMVQRLVRCEPWLGMTPTRAIRVLVVDEELGARAASRLMLRLGGPHENLRIFSMAGFSLGTDDGEQKLETEISDFRPDLVVFDSMTHLLAGIESENDSLLMGDVFRRLYRLREALSTAFLIIDHRSKWGRLGTPAVSELLDLILRGSTVKATQASTVWAMIRVDDGSANLIQAKRRESDRLLSIRVGYEASEDGPIVLSNLGTPEDLLGRGARAQLWVAAFVQDRGLVSRSEIVSAGVTAGHDKRSIERALTDLKRSKRLENPKHGFYRLPLGRNLAGLSVIEGGATDAPF
jgi:hypothetical protein